MSLYTSALFKAMALTLTDGQKVEFTVTDGQKGPQAENVHPQ